ncbi:MAG: prepilin-type N-terminal cleavage/methylation domain-containing protein [Pirellulales bacterium]|nr:prepilin-type N-terminal cleavage/methylation domain-containing protein [Pirellulales bacterium]
MTLPDFLFPVMTGSNPARSYRRSPGLTLIEVLLVLSVLVILASLSWPAIHQMFVNQGLRTAADQLRTAWLHARNDALNSGRVQRFSYNPLSSAYRVESGALECNSDEPAEQQAPALSAPGNSAFYDAGGGEYLPLVRQETLPEGIRILSLETDNSRRDTAAGQIVGGFGAGEELPSPSVFFYPDGTTSNARLVLSNQQGRSIVVSLRGLTGVITVSEITTLESGALP